MSGNNSASSLDIEGFHNVQLNGKIDLKDLELFDQPPLENASRDTDLFSEPIPADISGDTDLDINASLVEKQGLLHGNTFSTKRSPTNVSKPREINPNSTSGNDSCTINLREINVIKQDSTGKCPADLETVNISDPVDTMKRTRLLRIKRDDCKLILTVVSVSALFFVISLFTSPFVGRLVFSTSKSDTLQSVNNCAFQTKVAKFNIKTDMIVTTTSKITWEHFGLREEFVQLNETHIIAKENGTYLITVSLTLDGNTCKGNGYMTLRCIRNGVSETEKCAKEQLAPNITRTVEITDVISLNIGDYFWISGLGFDCIYTGGSFNFMTVTKSDVVCY